MRRSVDCAISDRLKLSFYCKTIVPIVFIRKLGRRSTSALADIVIPPDEAPFTGKVAIRIAFGVDVEPGMNTISPRDGAAR